MEKQILAALAALDPENDSAWTADGAPRMDAIETIVGDSGVTRAQVTAVDPTFNREVARQRRAAKAAQEAEQAAKAAVEPANTVQDPAPETTGVSSEELAEIDPVSPDFVEAVEAIEEPELTVLDKPLPEIMGNPELLELAIGELTTLATIQLKAKSVASDAYEQTSAKINICEKQLVRLQRGGTKVDNTGIRAYLDQQNKARAERAQRAKDFVAARITLADLNMGHGKLDAALANRGKDRTKKRPERMPL